MVCWGTADIVVTHNLVGMVHTTTNYNVMQLQQRGKHDCLHNTVESEDDVYDSSFSLLYGSKTFLLNHFLLYFTGD